MCARCDSTVRTLRKSCCAISLFVCPSAISRRTSISRSLSVAARPASLRLGREPRAELRMQIGAPARQRPHRLDQLGVGRLLQHVAERARPHRLARESGVVLHREHDDLGLRELLPQARYRLRGSSRRACSGRAPAPPGDGRARSGAPTSTSPASATTSKPSSESSSMRSPLRTTAWSSAITIFVGEPSDGWEPTWRCTVAATAACDGLCHYSGRALLVAAGRSFGA